MLPRFSLTAARLDALAIAAWGGLLLLYSLRGDLDLLIHRSYQPLTAVAAVALLVLAIARLRLEQTGQARRLGSHSSLLPRQLGAWILLITALLSFWVPPRLYANELASRRSTSELTGVGRTQPQSFRVQQRPEQRSIPDWIRTFAVYPEPDAYRGQPVNVTGFVMHPPDLPADTLLLSRFVLTCCAADAYPIGLPVRLPAGDRRSYPTDQWLRVEGQLTTDTLAGKRQAVIVARQLTPIAAPRNPYED